uniref:Putative glycerol-3-phosphate acyltransferase 3 n=1 Tax=Anthurium amnicola TaxID=1678845 RepID=A0A1D1YPM6_9ARAE
MAAKRPMLKTLLSFYVSLRRKVGSWLSPHRRIPHTPHPKFQRSPSSQATGRLPAPHREVLCSVEGGLLRSSSTFPYFMVVALEAGGGLTRALLLLLLYPLLCCVGEEVGLRVMAMVCFCGIKVEGFRLGRAVLPKHLLEGVGMEGFEMMTRSSVGKKVVCVTGMPRVMVEASLKEYLGVNVVVGRELRVAGGYYTGLMEENMEEGEVLRELWGEEGNSEGLFGLTGCNRSQQHPFFSLCKEVYTATSAEKKAWRPLPRDRYPKPLVFHDGRVAFRPTAAATLAMFVWLPFGCLLAVFRAVVFLSLPYHLFIPILAFTGMKNRLVRSPSAPGGAGGGGGQLYACNHRTLLDPVYVSSALRKALSAVVYSVSPLSEFLAPIKTVRLTRDREEDRRRMAELLRRGDLVVCPEGTTCREPYLLRFSPLFAEVAVRDVIPVAVDARVDMFYGTTAGGRKWLDPFFFVLNPSPSYTLQFLPGVPVVLPDGERRNSHEVANQLQGVLAGALGFEPTMLTRKDKYLMLADNEGVVKPRHH